LLVAAAQDGTISVWDAATHAERGSFKDPAGALDVALSPDGRTAAVGRPDGTVAMWDLLRGVPTASLAAHQGPVGAVAFSPDGTMLASGGTDETVMLWRVGERTPWARLVGHNADVLSLAWHPDGQTLYSGSTDQSITAWRVDPDTAQSVACLDLLPLFPDAAAPDTIGAEGASPACRGADRAHGPR
jgi:WD40 repeat protein